MKAATPPRRSAMLAALAATIAAGLLSRRYPLPGILAEHTGDALYTVAVFFGIRALLPTRPRTVAVICAFGWSSAVECSQLVHPGWLEALRATLPGRLVLGQGFQWIDLAAYAVGAGIAWIIDRTLLTGQPTPSAPPT